MSQMGTGSIDNELIQQAEEFAKEFFQEKMPKVFNFVELMPCLLCTQIQTASEFKY